MSEMSPDDLLPYSLGGLLYAPAINVKVAEKIINGAYPNLMSMAFCLEDTIMDDSLEQAEEALLQTLTVIKEKQTEAQKLPLLFVRVRTPQHLEHVHTLLEPVEDILTGYILPKFDLSNGKAYAKLITQYNKKRSKRLYIMPILESQMIAYKATRLNVLIKIRELLCEVREYVLNVRVGGNDFNNIYGLRRSTKHTIYDIGVIRDILVDIINVFGDEFVVSGAVWEYFGNDPDGDWATGLRHEIALDRLNGFCGKTAIHPTQLPIICEGMKVRKSDYEDALQILDWKSGDSAVAKSPDGGRMNEVKCHTKWARQIKMIGDIYGVTEGDDE